MISADLVGTIDLSQASVLRHISPSYQEMMRNVLALCEKNQLFEHAIIPTQIRADTHNQLILEHERIPFVMLPCEWPPFMYRDAGLFLLDLFLKLDVHHLYISDIHPFNMSFYKGQFCFIDFSAIQPGRISRFVLKNFIYNYIHRVALFSKGEWKRISALLNYPNIKIRHKDLMGYLNPVEKVKYLKFYIEYRSALKMGNIGRVIQVLKKWLLSYNLKNKDLGWTNYYQTDVLTAFTNTAAWRSKQKVIEHFLDQYTPRTVLDIAGNAGLYSYHAASRGIRTICFDNEYEAVNRCYQFVKSNQITNLIPAVVDFTAPSVRLVHAPMSSDNPITTTLLSLQERIGKIDLTMMFALVHHLVFSQRLTFTEIIEQAATFNTNYLCIELPSPSSQHVKLWLQQDVDNHFSWYSEALFVQVLETKYQIVSRVALEREPQHGTKDGDSVLFFCKKS